MWTTTSRHGAGKIFWKHDVSTQHSLHGELYEVLSLISSRRACLPVVQWQRAGKGRGSRGAPYTRLHACWSRTYASLALRRRCNRIISCIFITWHSDRVRRARLAPNACGKWDKTRVYLSLSIETRSLTHTLVCRHEAAACHSQDILPHSLYVKSSHLFLYRPGGRPERQIDHQKGRDCGEVRL